MKPGMTNVNPDLSTVVQLQVQYPLQSVFVRQAVRISMVLHAACALPENIKPQLETKGAPNA